MVSRRCHAELPLAKLRNCEFSLEHKTFQPNLFRHSREVPERYQMLQAIGSGAYGLVWLVLLQVTHMSHVRNVLFRRRRQRRKPENDERAMSSFYYYSFLFLQLGT
jgi:hypothetical protein